MSIKCIATSNIVNYINYLYIPLIITYNYIIHFK